MRVAVLDDDLAQLDLIRHTVAAAGHDCHPFSLAKPLLRRLRHETFDLLVIDWQLPDLSGPDVARWVRANVEHRVPILFVTNRGDETDVVTALSSGADDYMVKPLRVRELAARIHALIRRSYPDPANVVQNHGDYRIDAQRKCIEYRGESIELKPKEFQLAHILFSNLGRLMSRSHLQETVWGVHADISSRTLDTHVSHLRAKLGLRPERGFRLTSIYGVGYRLAAAEEAAEPAASQNDEEDA